MENQENLIVKLARKKVMKQRGFYVHSVLYVAAVLLFVVQHYFIMPFNFFPLKYFNSFAMAIWSIVYCITAIDMLITFRFFGKKWEERKIENIMNKSIKTQIWK
jgi:hypothetical protein